MLYTPKARSQAAGYIEQNFAGSLTAVPASPLAVPGGFYVPVYSSVSMSQGKLRADFPVTPSIHNASGTCPTVLKGIACFDEALRLAATAMGAMPLSRRDGRLG